MSIIKSVAEIATKKCLMEVRKVIDCAMPQIDEELTRTLLSDVAVVNHFRPVQDSMGECIAEKYKNDVIEQISHSTISRFRLYLTGDVARSECINACMKHFQVPIESLDRTLDDLHATIHILENDLVDRDNTISRLKDEKEKGCNLPEDGSSKQKQKKRKTKDTAIAQPTQKDKSVHPAHQFCRDVMRDFQKKSIWSHLARPHTNQKNVSAKIKFDNAIIDYMYDGKLRLRDIRLKSTDDLCLYKAEFVKLFEACDEKFNHPSIDTGKETISLLDVATEFSNFWNEKQADYKEIVESSATESDIPSRDRSKEAKTGKDIERAPIDMQALRKMLETDDDEDGDSIGEGGGTNLLGDEFMLKFGGNFDKKTV